MQDLVHWGSLWGVQVVTDQTGAGALPSWKRLEEDCSLYTPLNFLSWLAPSQTRESTDETWYVYLSNKIQPLRHIPSSEAQHT